MNVELSKIEEKAVNEFRDRLISEFGRQIKSITLFGSKARNEKSTDSDVDILVVVQKETLTIWDNIQSLSSEISLKYSALLSVKVIDLPHLNLLNEVQSGFIKNIEKDGARIWEAA